MINLSFSLSWLYQIFFPLSQGSYPSPHHGWFSTSRRNCLLLILSPCCGCIILVIFFSSLSLWFLLSWPSSTYPCWNFLLLVFLPRQNHLAYSCRNRLFASSISFDLSLSKSSSPFPGCLILVLIIFYLSWLLWLSLPLFSTLVYSSLHLLVIFSSSSIHLVNITSPTLVAIIYSPRWYPFTYTCRNHLLIFHIFLSSPTSSSPYPY